MLHAGVGVTPDDTRRYEGGDPIAFVMGANIRRRHLTRAPMRAITVFSPDLITGIPQGGSA